MNVKVDKELKTIGVMKLFFTARSVILGKERELWGRVLKLTVTNEAETCGMRTDKWHKDQDGEEDEEIMGRVGVRAKMNERVNSVLF